jgi:hypothetical protein
MDEKCREIIWQQFGAALDTLENAIVNCPDETWGDQTGFHAYWYMVYHTLFWLDYYLADSWENYKPPAPFTLGEMDPEGVFPDRVYSKEEMLGFLKIGGNNARKLIATMDEERAERPYKFRKAQISTAELILYTMRHLQHHSAQLNLLLRQRHDQGSAWVAVSKVGLRD